MFEFIQVVVMAIIQGIAEFLPISSSGHLLVVDTLFRDLGSKIDSDTITLNIVLHMGTLGAILVVYRKRILKLLTEDRRIIVLLIVGTIPTVIIGFGLKIFCEDVLGTPMVAGWMFLVTGLMLLRSSKLQGEMSCRNLTMKKAAVIGIVQGFAVLPGISRSGSTIVAGLFCGLRRDEAATFSFLLAIPAIGGAGLLSGIDLLQEGTPSNNFGLLGLGMFISFAVGIVSLVWLLRWLESGRLQYFAYWLFLLGPTVIVWQMIAAA